LNEEKSINQSSDAVSQASLQEETIEDVLAEREDERKRVKNKKRKYAKTMTSLEVGVWYSAQKGYLLGVVLGSIPGERNCYKMLKQDYNNIKRELRKLGLVFEDCMFAEESPDSYEKVFRDGKTHKTVGKLWHLHGVWRLAEPISSADLHSILSPIAGKIRGSETAYVQDIWDIRNYLTYSAKDAIKNHVNDENMLKRVLKSKGWFPPRFRDVESILKKWAVWHGALWKIDDDRTDYILGEYVPYAWDVSKAFLKEWCEGKSLRLDTMGITYYIKNEFVDEFEEIKMPTCP
jgi:hypothetical protein